MREDRENSCEFNGEFKWKFSAAGQRITNFETF